MWSDSSHEGERGQTSGILTQISFRASLCVQTPVSASTRFFRNLQIPQRSEIPLPEISA
jgi:hypothetical protein